MEKQYFCIGKVSSINYPNGTARVTYEDKDKSTTAEFSFLAWEYWMPKVGDQVVVGHLSNGRTSAVILGPVWHNDRRPVEGFEGLYRKEYNHKQGLAYERYDAKEEAFSQDVTGTVTIRPTESWTLQVGSCTITVDKSGSISITAPAGITVTTPTVNFKEHPMDRLTEIKRTIDECNLLLQLVELAHDLGYIDKKRMGTWTGKITDVKKMSLSWLKKDGARAAAIKEGQDRQQLEQLVALVREIMDKEAAAKDQQDTPPQ